MTSDAVSTGAVDRPEMNRAQTKLPVNEMASVTTNVEWINVKLKIGGDVSWNSDPN